MRPLAVLLTAVVATSAQAKLEIRDVQASYGSLGPERKSAEYVAGDQVFFRYTMAGLRTDSDGRTRCEVKVTVTDPKGKSGGPRPVVVQDMPPLGGGTLPGIATVDLVVDSPPGEYELAVEITDLIAKESASFRRKFTCKPVEFALVRLRFYQDKEGRVPARVGGVVRQTLLVHLRAVGFDRSRGELDVEMEMAVLDANGKPVTPRPIRTAVHNEKPEEVKGSTWVRFEGELGLNRPGDFILRITVTDTLTKKKVTFETPLRVAAP
jgi:hypothetical protein